MINLLLPYRSMPLSLNRKVHWSTQQRITKQIHRDVLLLCHSCKVEPIGVPVTVELQWNVWDRRVRDTDNAAPTIKALIDGLRHAGIIPADDHFHVVRSSCSIVTHLIPAGWPRSGPHAKRPWMVLIVRPADV